MYSKVWKYFSRGVYVWYYTKTLVDIFLPLGFTSWHKYITPRFSVIPIRTIFLLWLIMTDLLASLFKFFLLEKNTLWMTVTMSCHLLGFSILRQASTTEGCPGASTCLNPALLGLSNIILVLVFINGLALVWDRCDVGRRWFGLLGFNASTTARVISRRWNDDDEISFLVPDYLQHCSATSRV